MEKQIRHSYEFSGFKLDPDHKCLWRGEELIAITPKAFDTLLVLIENRGQIVDKDTLLNRVWENTFVEESTLAQNISTLRKIFASSGNDKQLIETFPRRGYRFVGEVSEVVDEMEFMVFERKTKTEIVTEEELDPYDDGNEHLTLRPAPKRTGFPGRGQVRIAAAFSGVVLIALAFAGYQYFWKPGEFFKTKFLQTQVTKLASNGNITSIAMSPDGKYLVLLEKKDDMQSLKLQQAAGANSIEIVPPTKDSIIGITFSPDNSHLYYTMYEKWKPGESLMLGNLYRIPILGGAPEQVVRDIDSPVAISPNGKKAAFIRGNPAEKENYLVLMDMESKTENKLITRKQAERLSTTGISWSPDGKLITVPAYIPKGVGDDMELLAINVDNGELRSLIPQPLQWIGQTAWLKDGSGIIMAAFTDHAPTMTDEIWLLSYPGGEIRKITDGINGGFGISVASDSNSIATVQSKRISSLWVMPSARLAVNAATPAEDPKKNENYIINKDIGDFSSIKAGMSWTTDGKLIYSSAKGGNDDLYIVNGDGTNPRQLTSDPMADVHPIISPAQNFMVFLSNRSGKVNLWRMNLDGTEQKQLTDFSHATSPSISPDGAWIYFSAYQPESTAYTLWKIPSERGNAIQLTNSITLMPAVSPDGKYVACYMRQIMPDGSFKFPLRLTLASSEDGSVIKQFEGVTFSPNRSPLQWTPDGKAVSYLVTEKGVSNIWTQPIDGSKPQKYSNWQTDEVFRYAWTGDSSKLAFEKGLVINDVLIINNVQR